MINLEEYLKDALADIDISQIVRQEIVKLVRSEANSEIKRFVKGAIGQIVENEINSILGEPIETDDGWGKKESYQSFEDLFKKEFRAKMNSSWEMKQAIEKHVKARVASLFDDSLKEVVDRIASELVAIGDKK